MTLLRGQHGSNLAHLEAVRMRLRLAGAGAVAMAEPPEVLPHLVPLHMVPLQRPMGPLLFSLGPPLAHAPPSLHCPHEDSTRCTQCTGTSKWDTAESVLLEGSDCSCATCVEHAACGEYDCRSGVYSGLNGYIQHLSVFSFHPVFVGPLSGLHVWAG